MTNATKTLTFRPQRKKLSFEWTATCAGPVVSCGAVETMNIAVIPGSGQVHLGRYVPDFQVMDFVPLQLLVHQDMSLDNVLEGLDALRALVVDRLDELKCSRLATASNDCEKLSRWRQCLEARSNLAEYGGCSDQSAT